LSASPIYRSAALYELAMLALYRRHRDERLRTVAELVEPGASVIEACCGPGALYTRWLRERGVSYVGLDVSEAFVRRLRRRGVDARLWDLREARPLPSADYVVMQGSLYQFLPDARAVVERLLAAAREAAIVVEPVRNVAAGPAGAWLAARLTDAGAGPERARFDEASLEALFAPYGGRVARRLSVAGGRELGFVVRASPPGAGGA
jgi:trans-aconitate methyltransferase